MNKRMEMNVYKNKWLSCLEMIKSTDVQENEGDKDKGKMKAN